MAKKVVLKTCAYILTSAILLACLIPVVPTSAAVYETEFNNKPSKSVFTTIPWLLFVSRDSKVEDYILRISSKDGQLFGYFTGFLTKKFGVKIQTLKHVELKIGI